MKGHRLSPRWRKLLVVVHVATSVGLLGTDGLVLTTAGAVLALVVLTPALAGLADSARAGAPVATADRLLLVRDSGAASIVLLATLVLSIYKPFGRVGERLRLRVAVTPGSVDR